MLQSNYTAFIFNCVQDQPIKDYEYLSLFSKILGMLVRKEYATIEIRHKDVILIKFIRVDDNITVNFSKKLYEECNFTTILNAYVSNAIRNANKQIKNNKKYEENFGSDFDVDAECIAQGTDCAKGK